MDVLDASRPWPRRDGFFFFFFFGISRQRRRVRSIANVWRGLEGPLQARALEATVSDFDDGRGGWP